MAKCVLRVTRQEAKVACGKYQLAGIIKAVREGVIHDMRLLWSHHSQEEDWGFLLIDSTEQQCFGMSFTSGPAERSLPSTDTVTGPL